MIDEATSQITHTTDIGTPVHGLAVDPAAGTAYATSRGLLFVYDLATNTVIAQLPVAGSSSAAVDPARDTAYVAGSAGVYVIQPCPVMGSTTRPMPADPTPDGAQHAGRQVPAGEF